MKQHRSFKKDMDLLSEAYGRIGGIHMSDLAQQAAGHLAAEDGEHHDKTGHDSDREIVAKAKEMGTASSWLIDAAEKHLDAGGSLTPRERDDFARDVEGHAEQDIARDHHEDEQENENDELNITQGGGTSPEAFGQEERTGY